MTTTYTAITIGPIYDTFSQAKRTRAIWAASYFFSFFMRKILEEAINQNWKVMLPCDYSLNDDSKREITKGEFGAGLYADRLYFINKSKTDLEAIVDDVIGFFADDIDACRITTKDTASTFLKRYLNLHIVEISLTDQELNEIQNSKNLDEKSDNSVLRILNHLLDNKELNTRYAFDFNENYLLDYFTLKWNVNSALKTDAFGSGSNRHFTSIGEISTNDLKNKYSDKYKAALNKDFKNADLEFITELSKTTRKNKLDKDVSIIEDYHKYYAVLYADGDNIGDLLKSVANDNNKLKTFSKKLLEFGILAEKTIADYGGNAIYLGGEDILAFLPIAFKEEQVIKTLALLIDNLDKNFKETLGAYAKEQTVTIPTLSYGLMLSYFKFPMREAMSQAHDLLETCKKRKDLFPDKNGVSVRFQKHSGQYMECFIDKSKEKSSKQIYDLLTKHIQATDKRSTLSGLIQRLRDNVFFTTFINALRLGRIDAFFENFFNEPVHTTNSTFIDYFKELANALKKNYLTDTGNKEQENNRVKEILFTVLRYYQFIQPKEN